AKWGALAGKYIRVEIWKDLNEMDAMRSASTWDWVLKQWKLNKTARNPVVHSNNFMSNIGLMDLIDVRARDLMRGIQEYSRKGELYQEGFEHGLFGHSYIDQEIKATVIDPVLKELEKNAKAGKYDEGNFINKLRFINDFTRLASEGAARLGRAIKVFDEKSQEWYRWEDEVFRMATFIRKRELGFDPHEAAAL
ncbi:MAG: hypothetical protein GTO41_27045, partial [Burkholderiales bacterium]|nr:hypothetical protein [Burkholderiales bacterium]